MNVKNLLDRLQGVTKTTDGWKANCPAHEDKTPSLSIAEGNDGRILVKCFAQCPTENVVKSIGLRMEDLMPERVRTKPARARQEAIYPYTDESGKPLFEVVRLVPKRFLQRRRDPNNPAGWIWETKGVRKPLFRLPAIVAAVAAGKVIHVAEGEKDVLALVERGLDATCNPGGAGKWTAEHATSLKGASVVVIADKDAPGRVHAQQVARSLHRLARSIKVIELPDVGDMPVKDAADFFAASGRVEDFVALCDKSKPWQPEALKVALPVAAKISEDDAPLIYESRSQAWWSQDSRGNYIQYSETSAKRLLKRKGWPKEADGSGISPLDRELLRLQREENVAYAGSLAGWNSGIHEINGLRVLVTDSPRPVEAIEQPCIHLIAFLRGLLGDEQAQWLICWINGKRDAVLSQTWRPGPAVFFAGPAHAGKSFLQHLITLLVGGRSAKPWRYISAGTDFNGDLFGAEHLCIEDEVPRHDIHTRLKVASSIKSNLFAKGVSCHAKNRQAITLEPRWVMTISVNDEPENLLIIPPLDESLLDKVAILKCTNTPRPVPEGMDEKEWLESVVKAEIAGLAHLIDTTEIPAAWRHPRNGVKAIQHPEILAALDSQSPESLLWDLIERHVLPGESPVNLWTGTAAELEDKLYHVCPTAAGRLFYWPSACGTYLGRLAAKHPELVERHRGADRNRWTIRRDP
jgi:hypothetical protein